MRDVFEQIQEASAFADELGLKNIVISLDWKSAIRPKADKLFAKGEVTFVSEYDGFWGGGKEYRKTMTNPTWADMLRAADESVEVTGDFHHIFLESLSYDRKKRTYTFWFGS